MTRLIHLPAPATGVKPSGIESWRDFQGVALSQIEALTFLFEACELLLRACGADAVGGLGFELGTEELFHRHPVSLVADFAAPAADDEKLLQSVQPLEQPFGCEVYPGPDGENDCGAEQDPQPVKAGRFVKELLGQLEEFDQPA